MDFIGAVTGHRHILTQCILHTQIIKSKGGISVEEKGFALISLALMIAGAYFLMQLAQRTERYKKEVMYAVEKESSIPMPDSQDTMPPTVQPTAIPTAMPTPTVLQQEFFSNIKIKIREDILQNLKLHGASKEVVKEELLIYANESGVRS